MMKQKLYKIILVITAALAFASCGIYKKYERPDISFADSLYRRLPTQTDTSNIAMLRWDELFTDPILQEWIKLGVENNTDLKIAKQRVDIARANLNAAKWALFPGANGSISGGTPGTVTIGADISRCLWKAPKHKERCCSISRRKHCK